MSKRTSFLLLSFFLMVSFLMYGIYSFQKRKEMVAQALPIKAIIQSTTSKEKLKTEVFIELLGLTEEGKVDLNQFDLEKAEEKLRNFALIKEVKLKKVFPDALHIEYTLRTPFFFVKDFTNKAIDQSGFLFPVEPYLSPKKLPEVLLGISNFSSNVRIEDRRFILVKELLFLLNESTDLEINKIDVSKAYIPEYGQREILLSIEDRLFNGHNIFYFPFVLRLSPSHFGKQLANFLTLRKAILEDYNKQLKAAKVSHRFKERIIDLRIESLALIENE